MQEITLMDVINVINKSENLKLSANQLEDNLSELGMDSITFIQILTRFLRVVNRIFCAGAFCAAS